MPSKKSVSTIVPKDIYLEDLNFVYSDAAISHEAPIKKDQYISTVRISYGNLCLAEAELYAMNSVQPIQKSYTIKPSKPGSNILVTILVIITIAVMLVGFVLFAWPRIRYIRRRNQRSTRRGTAKRRG